MLLGVLVVPIVDILGCYFDWLIVGFALRFCVVCGFVGFRLRVACVVVNCMHLLFVVWFVVRGLYL